MKKTGVSSHILYSQKQVSKKKRAKIEKNIATLERLGMSRVEQARAEINMLLTLTKDYAKSLRAIRHNLQVLERLLDDGKSGVLRYYLEELRMLEAENQGFIQSYKATFDQMGDRLG